MKLYGAMASPFVARVAMFAKLKGVDLPISEPIGGNIKSPEFLKLNPIGKMPTFEVDGKGLAESAIICEYLEDAYPQKSGLPADIYEKNRSRLIARLVDLYMAPEIGKLFRQLNPEKRDQAQVDAAAADLKKAFGYIEGFMGTGPFCSGSTPTLGDCALGPYMVLAKLAVFANFPTIPDPTSSGRLGTWWQAMESHAVCKEIDDAYGKAFSGFLKFMVSGGRPGAR